MYSADKEVTTDAVGAKVTTGVGIGVGCWENIDTADPTIR